MRLSLNTPGTTRKTRDAPCKEGARIRRSSFPNGMEGFLIERNARPGSLSRDVTFRYLLTEDRSTDILCPIHLGVSCKVMKRLRHMWIHPATYTYREDAPENLLETLWVERPGWGYLLRRDLWLKTESSAEELVQDGYVQMNSQTDEEVSFCPFCRMYICAIPGYLKEKHFLECGGGGENHLALEDAMVSEQRRLLFERKILAQRQREKEELEEMERKERFDRVKEEAQTRQLSKDRKKRLKEYTKEFLRKKL